jgi:DNA-binding transcriptional ArsR family regulator
MLDQDWVAVEALASRYSVTKRAVQKRVAKFRDAGQLTVRQHGKTFLVHGPTYERLVGEAFDPAQALRNRHVKRGADRGQAPPVAREAVAEALDLAQRSAIDAASLDERVGDAPVAGPEPSRFNDAAAREKNAKAQLAEMQLAQKRGELVPVREIEAAAIEASTRIAQRLNAMKACAGKLYAAAKGGEDALHVELLAIVNAAIAAVGEDMAALAARGAPEPDSGARNDRA